MKNNELKIGKVMKNSNNEISGPFLLKELPEYDSLFPYHSELSYLYNMNGKFSHVCHISILYNIDDIC